MPIVGGSTLFGAQARPTILLLLSIVVAAVAIACSSSTDNTQIAEPVTADPITDISVSDSWVRPGIDSTAIYFTVSNSGSYTVTLSGVDASWAGEIDMHQTVNDDGFLRMEHMAYVSVPAGGSVAFEPGGMHVMAQDIHNAISEGDNLAVALLTTDGTTIDFSAVARGGTEIAMTSNDISHDHDAGDGDDSGLDVEKHGAVISSGTILPRKSFEFTFDHSLSGIKVPYHNHLDGSQGTVMVMEGAEVSGEVTVTIRADGFQPADLHVAPGTEVTWVNTTDVAWTVISGFPPR